MTHGELVARAASWLRNSARIPGSQPGFTRRVQCGVVLTEYVAGWETPDAIGWCDCARQSILVECKATRSDFLADQKKYFRRNPASGVGIFRYYLTNPGIVTADELPVNWGLLEANGRRVRLMKLAAPQERDVRFELGMLWSECRKIQIVERGGKLMPTRAGLRVAQCVETRKSLYAPRVEVETTEMTDKFAS